VVKLGKMIRRIKKMKNRKDNEKIGFPTLKEILQDCFGLDNKAIKKVKEKYPNININKEIK